jgi:uncharacterized membrane protein YsdA (DUF1294 family)
VAPARVYDVPTRQLLDIALLVASLGVVVTALVMARRAKRRQQAFRFYYVLAAGSTFTALARVLSLAHPT